MPSLKKIILSLSRIYNPNGSNKEKKGKQKDKKKEIGDKKLKKRRDRTKRTGETDRENFRWMQRKKKDKNCNGRPTTRNSSIKTKDFTSKLRFFNKTVKMSLIKIKALYQQEEAQKEH